MDVLEDLTKALLNPNIGYLTEDLISREKLPAIIDEINLKKSTHDPPEEVSCTVDDCYLAGRVPATHAIFGGKTLVVSLIFPLKNVSDPWPTTALAVIPSNTGLTKSVSLTINLPQWIVVLVAISFTGLIILFACTLAYMYYMNKKLKTQANYNYKTGISLGELGATKFQPEQTEK